MAENLFKCHRDLSTALESGQRLENADQTYLVLASSKLELQKKFRAWPLNFAMLFACGSRYPATQRVADLPSYTYLA